MKEIIVSTLAIALLQIERLTIEKDGLNEVRTQISLMLEKTVL